MEQVWFIYQMQSLNLCWCFLSSGAVLAVAGLGWAWWSLGCRAVRVLGGGCCLRSWSHPAPCTAPCGSSCCWEPGHCCCWSACRTSRRRSSGRAQVSADVGQRGQNGRGFMFYVLLMHFLIFFHAATCYIAPARCRNLLHVMLVMCICMINISEAQKL